MVIAHHIILTGYGHWLPNDPRGSLSTEVHAGRLISLGDLHLGRKKKQPAREALREFQRAAKQLLEHKVLWFDAPERQAISEAFGEVIEGQRYTCFACAILSNHAHLVIRKHRDKAETMIAEFKRTSARHLRSSFKHVPVTHPIWSGDPYKKFISAPRALVQSIQYVVDNPAKSGLPPQNYDFVKPYRGEWSRKPARKTTAL